MARSGSFISAIFASTSGSPLALPACLSRAVSFIAARSSSVNVLLAIVAPSSRGSCRQLLVLLRSRRRRKPLGAPQKSEHRLAAHGPGPRVNYEQAEAYLLDLE